MEKLDKKRAYGRVVGIADHVYEQDGKDFNASGEEIRKPLPAILPQRGKNKPIKNKKAQ